MLGHEGAHKICPVNFRTRIRDLRRALAIAWFKSSENVRGPISLRRWSIPERLPRLGWQRGTDCTPPWGRPGIPTPLRLLGRRRFFIPISAFVPVADQGGIVRWGQTPC